jgi:hypothetical protein
VGHASLGRSSLCEGNDHFEINVGARYNIYFARHLVWLTYFTCHLLLVPVLAPNYKQHILSPAKVAFFRCHNTPNIKNELALLSQLILFRIIMLTKGITALWASFAGPIFHTISTPAL